MVKKLFIVIAFVLCSCTNDYLGMIMPSTIVEKRFEQSIANNKEIVLTSTSDDYRVYIGSDVHIVNTANNLKQLITAERNDPKAIASIILGDFVTKKGTMHIAKEAMKFDSNIQAKNDTVFTVVGNHDTYFNQWSDYLKLFNSSTYYFSVKTPNAYDLFIILDSANGTLGHSQMEWLKQVLKEKRSSYRHCIIGTHSNFFRNYVPLMLSGNYTMEETLEFTNLASTNKVDVVFQGHHHGKDFIQYDKVEYILIETLQDEEKDAGYLVVNISDKITYDSKKIATAK